MKRSLTQDIRAFNRFYTNVIGLLDRHILNSSYSLPEVRVLYEINHHNQLTASEIIELLDIDKGYLSRILRRFEKNKLVKKVTSASDRRSAFIALTEKGKKEFEELDISASKHVEEVFEGLSESECTELVQRMKRIQQILSKKFKR